LLLSIITQYAGAAPAKEPIPQSLVFIVDTSGSMNQKLADGITKLNAAKEAVTLLLNEHKKSVLANEYALISYQGCEPILNLPFTKNPVELENILVSLKASGETPIARSMELAIEHIKKSGTLTYAKIILLTDGDDTCGGDPVGVAKRLRSTAIVSQLPGSRPASQGKCIFSYISYFTAKDAYAGDMPARMISLSVIGFTKSGDPKKQTNLRAIASAAQGTYYSAENKGELLAALKRSADESIDLSKLAPKEEQKPAAAPTAAPAAAPAAQEKKTLIWGLGWFEITLGIILIVNLILAVVIIYIRSRKNKYTKGNASISMAGDDNRHIYRFNKAIIISRDMLLGTDQSISNPHARIQKTVDGYIIEDMGSKNGTFLNKSKISRAFIKDGDEIQVGKSTFTFRLKLM